MYLYKYDFHVNLRTVYPPWIYGIKLFFRAKSHLFSVRMVQLNRHGARGSVRVKSKAQTAVF